MMRLGKSAARRSTLAGSWVKISPRRDPSGRAPPAPCQRGLVPAGIEGRHASKVVQGRERGGPDATDDVGAVRFGRHISTVATTEWDDARR